MTMSVVLMLAVVQDSVAYVAQRSGPPATEGYMWAGYAITFVSLAGYVVLMARRIAKSKRP
jgi:hypothetical protein